MLLEERPGPLTLALPAVDLFWAIEARYAADQLALLREIDWQVHAREFAAEQARRAQAEDVPSPPKPYRMTPGGTAVFHLTGPLTKREQSWGGGTSTIHTRHRIRQARTDPDVRQGILIFDTPGGQVKGTELLGNDVAAFAREKPLVAYVDDLCASAGYWIASQARTIYANGSAFVGSIGTYAVIEDVSRLAADQGIQVHVIRAGQFKGAGEPGTQITESQLEEFQREVNDANEEFLKAVAQGRRMDLELVRSLADGRIHVAKNALAFGLIDGIRSLDDVLTDLEMSGALAGTRAASGGKEEGAAMSRMESFLAWLKGEGAEEEPQAAAGGTVTGITLVQGEPFKPLPGQVSLAEDEHTRLTAQATAGKTALGAIRDQILKDDFTATGKQSPKLKAVADRCVEEGDYEHLCELAVEQAEKVGKVFKPGTYADRSAATQKMSDGSPERPSREEIEADARAVVARSRGKHIAIGTNGSRRGGE